MPDLLLKTLYVLGLLIQIIIRAPIDRLRRQNKIVVDQVNQQEMAILSLLLLGNFLVPMVYVFTPWLNFANYALPAAAHWLGVVVLAGALWVFWRAHHDLGRNWSPSLQIRDGQALITRGIYQAIRHPMYASQWLWVLAQALLLPNWIAGLSGVLVFVPFYFVRVRAEEQLMLDHFGDQYQAYAARTGGVLPHQARRP